MAERGRDKCRLIYFRITNLSFLYRHHRCNHTACSRNYDMEFFPFLRKINSQVCEQKNRKLRKLAKILAYENFENYMKIIEIFFALTNMEIKGIMWNLIYKIHLIYSCYKIYYIIIIYNLNFTVWSHYQILTYLVNILTPLPEFDISGSTIRFWQSGPTTRFWHIW